MGEQHEQLRLGAIVDGEVVVDGGSPGLVAAVEEQRRVQALLAALPREPPVPDFVTRVMSRLPARELSVASRWRQLLLAPRQLTLRWNMAMALGLAAVVAGVAVTGASVLRWRAGHLGAAQPAGAVTFVFVAPHATSVAVAGDFNDWQPAATALRDEDGDGVWLTRVALSPGRHEYMFVVNGQQWVSDPLARVHRPDGFGHQNAVLDL